MTSAERRWLATRAANNPCLSFSIVTPHSNAVEAPPHGALCDRLNMCREAWPAEQSVVKSQDAQRPSIAKKTRWRAKKTARTKWLSISATSDPNTPRMPSGAKQLLEAKEGTLLIKPSKKSCPNQHEGEMKALRRSRYAATQSVHVIDMSWSEKRWTSQRLNPPLTRLT